MKQQPKATQHEKRELRNGKNEKQVKNWKINYAEYIKKYSDVIIAHFM